MKLAGQAPRDDSGYAMAVLLVSLSVMAVLITVAMPVWHQAVQREKEEELVFRGKQYARAIGLFQRKFANAFPPNFDVLVEQHFLRRKYKDPMATNEKDAEFQPLFQTQQAPGAGSATTQRPGQSAPSTPPPTGLGPGGLGSAAGSVGAPAGPRGGVIGVTSKSKDKSIRLYNGRSHYNEWAFVYTQQTQQPGLGPGQLPSGNAPASPPGSGPIRTGGPPTRQPGQPGSGPPRPPGPGGPRQPGGLGPPTGPPRL